MTLPALHILCEDGPLLAVNKPAGLPTQAPAHVDSLEARVKAYLKEKHHKSGNVYLGVPHRLDRPVSGVVIFARNSKAAARLAEQFRERQVRKWYLAVVEPQLLPSPLEGESGRRPDEGDVTAAGELIAHSEFRDNPLTLTLSPNAGERGPEKEGTLSDWLLKVPDMAEAQVVPEGTPGAKLAMLDYRVLQTFENRALVLVELHTGRMHQIRVQFASRGWPIVGDRRYGSPSAFPGNDGGEEIIALHAARLELMHPIRYEPLSLVAPLPTSWEAFGVVAVDELVK